MKSITKAKEFTGDNHHNSVSSMINYRINNKDKILAFLKSVEPYAVASCYTTDFIKNEHFYDQSLMLYEKDGYTWSNEIIYHFEHYDLKLNDDFITYVLK
jgi:hypothetical protein